jgi:hypothetical protein
LEPLGPGELTIDQFARIANALRYDQLVSREMYYPLSPIDLWRVEEAYDSLKFYGCLSNSQKAATRTADGIRMIDLDSRQQQIYADCAIKLVLESGSCSIELAKSLAANGNIQARLGSARFRVKVIDNNVSANDGRTEITDGNEVFFKPIPGEFPAAIVELRFEFSDTESMVQSIVLKK